MRPQAQRLGRVLVVGDVDGVYDSDDVDDDGQPRRGVVLAGPAVGFVEDGACEGEGEYGENKDDEADDERHHGVVE